MTFYDRTGTLNAQKGEHNDQIFQLLVHCQFSLMDVFFFTFIR